jgi:hypothetical protein
MNSTKSRYLCLALAATFVACHNSTRDNPMDPVLTPAVDGVRVEVGDSTGVAVVEWIAYSGQTQFAAYLVQRREKALFDVVTLARITEAAETTFADSSIEPGRDYVYWVEVVNSAGFVVASEELAVESFTVAGVELTSVEPSAATGHIELTWDRYDGPGFEGYEIWRRAVGEDATRLDVITDARVTTWTDTTARPGTVYFYWTSSLIFDVDFASARSEVSYELPAVAIQSLTLSSDTAAAS